MNKIISILLIVLAAILTMASLIGHFLISSRVNKIVKEEEEKNKKE